jgi:pilus assembly protein CpaE
MDTQRRILVVDDDPDTLRLITLVLERRGFQVAQAQDGPTALEMARAAVPDLVVLDAMMPGMDGFSVARLLRSHPVTAHVRILMFTAKNTVDDRVEGYEAGVDGYLSKPVHPVEMLAHVQALMPDPAPPEGRIVSFVGTVPVSQVAAFAASSARALAGAGASVILAELCASRGALAGLLGVPPGGLENLNGLLSGEIMPQEVAAALVHCENFRVLTASDDAVLCDRIAPHLAVGVVGALAALADLTFIANGGPPDALTRRLARHSHHLVLLSEPSRDSLASAGHLLKSLRRGGLGQVGVSVVLRSPQLGSSRVNAGVVREGLDVRYVDVLDGSEAQAEAYALALGARLRQPGL